MVAETCFKIMLINGTQSSLTLCDPMDCNPAVPPVHEILPARILEWVPPLGDLRNPGIKLKSPALAGKFFTTELTGKPRKVYYLMVNFMCRLE